MPCEARAQTAFERTNSKRSAARTYPQPIGGFPVGSLFRILPKDARFHWLKACEDYTRYNLRMNPSTAASLIEINREFYTRFGDSFSATRHRLQPGVRRALRILKGDESILDLGCGNGELARELAKHGHRGSYLGVDFSLPLLRDAEAQPEGLSARFMQADLTQLPGISDQLSVPGGWSLVTAFAVLHHIPSTELRLDLLRVVHKLLKDNGLFIHSNWQFLNSEKLKARIQPWEVTHLSASD